MHVLNHDFISNIPYDPRDSPKVIPEYAESDINLELGGTLNPFKCIRKRKGWKRDFGECNTESETCGGRESVCVSIRETISCVFHSGFYCPQHVLLGWWILFSISIILPGVSTFWPCRPLSGPLFLSCGLSLVSSSLPLEGEENYPFQFESFSIWHIIKFYDPL